MSEAVPTAAAPRRIAFIGLGVMGHPMAGHLARAGHAVTVFNRTTRKARQWVKEYGGHAAATPRQATDDAEFVFVCVGNDADLRSVVLGDEGAFAGMANGSTLVDHTTASAAIARELHTIARERGLHFVDAPVSGGQSGAANGTLTVMCGGDEAVIDALRPVTAAYSRAVTRVGPGGAGQLAKMVNQICIAGLLQGLSEGIAFGEKVGLDMPVVLDVLAKGAAQSWQMDNRGRTMLADQFDFGFAVKWMIKDLGMTLDEARRHGVTLPVTTLVEQFYQEISRMGGDRWDTSSLVRRLRRRMEIDIILNEFASPGAAAELGLMAERYGVRGVWASNYSGSRDAFFTLSLLAHQSSRIRIGPMAISPAELHPLKMANLLFSLNELSGGRAMLMVGGGGGVTQAIGRKRERMIRGSRECLEILKGASPDKTMNYNGEIYKVWGYRPQWYTDKPPLIYFGSNHPQSRKLSAELADGLITSDFVVPLMKEFISKAHEELRAARRSPQDFRIGNFWAWHIKKDPAASMAEARRELMLRGWLGEQYFAPFLDPDEVRLMRAHERDFLNAFLRHTGVIENVPDALVTKMIRNISFAGGLDQIEPAIETLKAFAAAGLTEIALRVHDDPADAIRVIGERVLPALR